MKTKSTQYSGVIQLQRINESKLTFARDFRKDMTPAEAALWERLRGRKCGGLKFRRQQIIEGFIADFFCAERNLVIEVDGPVHESKGQQAVDDHRRKVFALRGIREMRFRNEEVLSDTDDVVRRIIEQA